jgi:4'-phosphopantetheinyl transferase
VTAPAPAWLHDLPPIVPAETLAPSACIIDLWSYAYTEVTDASLRARQAALMTAEERARHDRLVGAGNRALFLATRALIRATLSHYRTVAPTAWRFGTHARGKPHVASPAGDPRLHFNLSNTDGLVVCAVSTSFEALGVDTEPTDRRNAGVALADRYFSSTEVAALRALPEASQQRRFLSYWTLKESYIKARGLGLAIPLDQFSFLIDDGRIGISFDPRLGDTPGHWRFVLMDARPNHLVAIGADTGGVEWRLRGRSVVPLLA